MKYFYADAQNKPVGPIDLDELKRLLASNVIGLLTNVIPEGATVWVPFSSVLALSKSGEAGLDSPPDAEGGLLVNGPGTLATAIGKVLDKARILMPQALVERVLWFCTTWGQVLVLFGAMLGLVLSLVLWIRYGEFRIFLVGAAGVLALVLLQYVTKNFLLGCFSQIKAVPSSLPSAAVLDGFALLQLIAAVILLAGGFVLAIQSRQPVFFLNGLAGCFVSALTGAICFHPRIANTEIKPAGASEEAMGILAFLLKLGLAILPAWYFLLALAAIVAITASLFGSTLLLPVSREIGPLAGDLGGIGTLVSASLLPFIVYLGFLLGCLALDLIRSVVGLPGKVDALKR